eukprot:CAMPEP_0206230212 /NCGR_PEP_ID=MMETSP0047_2-20121206/10123_1 /ASSEMBLY_ACC=CAM_ASM_000192 /TAXON_ID=195065 /ORGANISM="Chroomonas mesostigmatica_cf, Strain CCMP1168" /LENGTH=377 /DNA_ID=CAMNT_0053653589 /DNA_START=92 /DNA_END=1225 /DNA_ORIENTATION=-
MRSGRASARLVVRGAQRLSAAPHPARQAPRAPQHAMQRPPLAPPLPLGAAVRGLVGSRHKVVGGRGMSSGQGEAPDEASTTKRIKEARRSLHLKFTHRIDELRSRAALLQSRDGGLPPALAMELKEVLKFLNRAQLVVDTSESLTEELQATSEKYDPPEATRSSMPNSFRESFMREVVMNALVWIAERYLHRNVDRDFLEVFALEMLQTYPAVRQITSNSRDASELDLLRGLVSSDLVDILQENIGELPAAMRAKGVEVHDVAAEVCGLHFITEKERGVPANGMFSFDPSVKPRTYSKRHEEDEEDEEMEEVKEEWVQVHILFSAWEKDTIWSEGAVVQRAPPVLRESVWVYEGQLLGGHNSLQKHRNWSLVAIKEA